MMRSPLAPAALTALVLVLAGCSPHPGAGEWEAVSEDAPFSRLKAHFKGWADLYRPEAEEAAYHCFWGARGERTIALTCTPADDTEAELRFDLVVEEAGRARLVRNEQLVARFRRMPR